MSDPGNVGVVRLLWVAARENDVDALLSLTTPDVEWRPTAVTAPGLHGRDALRGYLDGLRTVGTLLDAHPYSFEAVGDCVIVPSLSDEQAKPLFPKGWKALRPYLRMTPQPNK